MFQTKFVEKIRTHFSGSIIFYEYFVFYEIMWKKYFRAGCHRRQHGACALHAWYL